MNPTSEQIVNVFNKQAKSDTKESYIFHVIGTPTTYKYNKEKSTMQTFVKDKLFTEDYVPFALQFNDFLNIAHAVTLVAIVKNSGEN